MKSLVSVILFAGLLATPISASTFVHMDDLQMVSSSKSIVRGEIVDITSFWTESGNLIATEATLKVEAIYAGSAQRVVTVRTWGGTIDGFTVEADGFPRFEKGSEVILFLEQVEGDAFHRIVNYQRGHYKVVTRLDGVTLAVPQTDDEARMLKADGTLAPAPQSVEIGRFESNLRALAIEAGRLEK
jgi:hypothetical protein